MASQNLKVEKPEPIPGMSGDYLEPEYANIYGVWKKQPSPKSTGQLLKAVQPVLDTALRSYGGASPSPTMQSKAKLLAVEAFHRYDPKRAKLRTHLMTHLQGLRRMGIKETQIIGLPERVGLDLGHLRRAEDELTDRLGRAPSTLELADHSGMSMKRIAHVRKAQPGLPEGSLESIGDPGEETQSLGPAVVSGEGEKIWHEFVYHDLAPEDQLIMEHTLGLHGKPVLSKQLIAKRLRISPGAVTQRAARIQQKLDQKEELGGAFFAG